MFLARVLIGDYINGDSKYMRPPSKDGSYVNLYDSCVDDTWDPKIFVVFDANQIYPEYLIDFYWFHFQISVVKQVLCFFCRKICSPVI